MLPLGLGIGCSAGGVPPAQRADTGLAPPPPSPRDPDAAALALLPPVVAYSEAVAELTLSRQARRPGAFAGYDGLSVSDLFVVTTDRFGGEDYGGSLGGGDNRYLRRATIVRSTVRVR